MRAHFLVHSRGFNTEFSQGGGLPWWLRGYSVCLQCGRPGFDPWVGKIPWRRKWQPTPVLLPGESHGRRSLGGSTGLQRVDFTFTFRKLKSQVMQSKKKKKNAEESECIFQGLRIRPKQTSLPKYTYLFWSLEFFPWQFLQKCSLYSILWLCYLVIKLFHISYHQRGVSNLSQ